MPVAPPVTSARLRRSIGIFLCFRRLLALLMRMTGRLQSAKLRVVFRLGGAMHRPRARIGRLAAVALLMAAPGALAAEANAIHQRTLTLDSHLDTPMSFGRPGWSMMENHTYADDLSQVDYPRMVRGGLDGGFFAIYTAQGTRTPEGYANARDQALKRAVEIREMVARNPGYFELATKADDAARIVAARKRVVYQSMENAYPLGKDLTLLRTFRDLGVRMVGPVHFSNNDFADSATDPKGPEWNG